MRSLPPHLARTLLLALLLTAPGCDVLREIVSAPESGEITAVVHDVRVLDRKHRMPKIHERHAYTKEQDAELYGVLTSQYFWLNRMLPPGIYIDFVSFDGGRSWVPISFSGRDLADAATGIPWLGPLFLRPPGAQGGER